jgi:triacylglycerol lipase
MKLKSILAAAIISLAAFQLYSNGTFATGPTTKGETVILLHGLARSDRAMNKLANALRNEGYRVINPNYPSTTADIDTLTTALFKALEPQISPLETVHFVTHSMGGILLQRQLDTAGLPNLGRVVMLAPPSQGSEVPDKLRRFKLYQKVNGPAGNQLGTDAESIPLQLNAPDYPLGVIAGDRSINPILSLLIPGPDDGKVATSRVRPAACTDFRLLHVTHPCMVWNPRVIAEVKHFLKHESFMPEEALCFMSKNRIRLNNRTQKD